MIFAYLFVVAFIVDWALTLLYCSIRKKKDNQKMKDCGSKKSSLDSPKHSTVKSELLKFIDGYILYKSIMIQYLPSHHIRKFYLKYQFRMDIHKGAMIYHGGEFRNPWNITIGQGTSVGDHVKIDGRNKVVIGNNVNIGSGVWIWTEQHDYNDPDFACNDKGGMVKIEDRVWVSCRVTILPNVTVGEGAVLGAGAVVTKNCDNYVLYVGCPAKKIGVRNSNLKYELAGRYLHFY